MHTPPPPSPAPLDPLPADPALVALWARAALANPYGVAILDAARGTIVAVNEAAARLLQAEPADVVGRNARELYAPGEHERIGAWFRRTEAGLHARFEAELVCADGRTVPAELTLHAVRDAEGCVTHHVAAFRDVTRRRAAWRESQEYEQRLRALAQQLEHARESDRHALGVMLHERLRQSLTALGLGLERLRHGLEERRVEEPALLQVIATLQANIAETIATERESVAHLRPEGIERLGLWPALEHYVETWSRTTRIPVQLDLAVQPELEAAVALGAFRALQEALTNVGRHARATHVHVASRPLPGRVEITVADDGIGVTRADLAKPRAFGVLAMTERVRGLDGTVTVDRAAPAGTCVTIRVPARGDR